ncbi:MAG TPA: DUF58 domain-containing protein [Acidimicrobiales bacterium]|nr:DUF58 domain-containing protein [Acidimicrobiales bacterium]
MRPLRPLAPFGLSGAVLVGWGLVAHNSGSGWVQLVGEAVGATLVVGLLGPAWALARSRLEIVGGDSDATAGEPADLLLRCSRRVRVRPVAPPGPDATAGPGPRRAEGPPDVMEVVAPRHCLLDTVVVDVQSAAPFGIAWWTRRVVLALPAPLHVAPRLGAARPLPRSDDLGSGDGSGRTGAVVGDPRAVRQYRPGDSRRRVHWPATAHSGTLMVRETEAPTRRPTTVVVSLPPDDDAAERTTEEALGTVLARLAQGVPVVLVTTEAGGVAHAPVPHQLAARRRLARAVATTSPATGAHVAGLADGADDRLEVFGP